MTDGRDDLALRLLSVRRLLLHHSIIVTEDTDVRSLFANLAKLYHLSMNGDFAVCYVRHIYYDDDAATGRPATSADQTWSLLHPVTSVPTPLWTDFSLVVERTPFTSSYKTYLQSETSSVVTGIAANVAADTRTLQREEDTPSVGVLAERTRTDTRSSNFAYNA
ncbi:hypothetical protein FIBSPDRAFT_963837 [Athelia psychrophila]|uniref:Uncharacterized protein n=1 Tax=Athelia psychrophila TaxID=1759441 RepID=A0A165YJR8_9AGAM|nr:hypothetical protein FIBSPDRAFT_963837 [Fibularhizoctonia sp. CBS 109695]